VFSRDRPQNVVSGKRDDVVTETGRKQITPLVKFVKFVFLPTHFRKFLFSISSSSSQISINFEMTREMKGRGRSLKRPIPNWPDSVRMHDAMGYLRELIDI
jgi:hypothetical protein